MIHLFFDLYRFPENNVPFFYELGCQEGRQKRRQGSGQGPQEERGRRWQGQEEEVVQGKDTRQVEQLGAL